MSRRSRTGACCAAATRLIVVAMLPVLHGCSPEPEVATPADGTPPEVMIESPLAGSSVADTVGVVVRAQDAGGVHCVTLLADTLACGTRFAPPWRFTWVTGTLPDSSFHTLQAEAVDAEGNRALSAACRVCVRINHAPHARILRPYDEEWCDLADTSAVWRCEVSDPDEGALPAERVEWSVDGTALAARGTIIPAPILPPGTHEIRVGARDRWEREAWARARMTAFRYPSPDRPEAALELFLIALRARNAAVATSVLAAEFRAFAPRAQAGPNMWGAEREAAALTALLVDADPVRVTLAASAGSPETFTLRGRSLAKIELRNLELTVRLACDSGHDPRPALAARGLALPCTTGEATQGEIEIGIENSAARIFLVRDETSGTAPWCILSWWDLHGATGGPPGEYSWSELKRTAGEHRLCP